MAAAPQYQPNAEVTAMVAKINDLAVLPHVVYKVLELSGNTESSAGDIERAIVTDPGFSSKLLTVANSAYYGLPRKISSIREAITFLGFRSIRQIAMTVGLYDMFVGKSDKESMRRRTWWRHSIDTAVTCKRLSSKSKRLLPDEAYTAGLLHMIGRTLLDRFGGKDYGLVEKLVEQGLSEMVAEEELYGCTSIEVGIAAGEKWGFPAVLVSGLDYVSIPSEGEEFLAHRSIVAIGTGAAKGAVLGLEYFENPNNAIPDWALTCHGFTQEDVPTIVGDATVAISEAAGMQF